MMSRKNFFSLSVLPTALVVFCIPSLSSAAAPVDPGLRAEYTRPREVKVWNQAGEVQQKLLLGDQKVLGGGYLVHGDVDGDGVPEFVVGAGMGQEPRVMIFDENAKLKHSFLAYPIGFRGGVRVALGDIDGDHLLDIVTAPGPGFEPRVYAFHADGKKLLTDGWLTYATSMKSGIHLAVGDLDLDGRAEVITAPGPGAGPDVRIWNVSSVAPIRTFFAFDAGMMEGVNVAYARTPEGPSIITAIESWDVPLVRRYAYEPNVYLVRQFAPYRLESRFGVNVAAVDIDADGYDELALTPNGGQTPDITIVDVYGGLLKTVPSFDVAYKGAISIASYTNGTQYGFATLPSPATVIGPLDQPKMIGVDIRAQRLHAYEHGRVAKTFLVSTGVARHPTPIGKTTVRKKIPIMDYRWNYGPGNPDNYNLKNVKFNLNIFDHVYIHTAYWHNNFGHPMSHGCVNMRLADAQWVYDWAPTGTPVETYK